jgi:hypothetical protein
MYRKFCQIILNNPRTCMKINTRIFRCVTKYQLKFSVIF